LDKVNDPTEGETGDFHNFSPYIFVSCWTSTDEENLALWNMYTPQMRGVRIELPMPIFKSYDPILGKNQSLIPTDKCFNREKHFFTNGGESQPFRIEYTDEPEKLKPNVITQYGIQTSLLGHYKRLIWSFEKEYRFKIDIIPFDPRNKSDNFIDQYGPLLNSRTPPPINYYDIDIDNDSFSKMIILLSPKFANGDYEIVASLIEKFNPKANIQISKLKGLVK
jgi:hypothetical protein